MKIEDVTPIIEEQRTVIHEYNGIAIRYKVQGVITRFNHEKGWYYVLELKDLKANSITIARIEDVRAEKMGG